jgi:predicted PurR-regulated permease PerM
MPGESLRKAPNDARRSCRSEMASVPSPAKASKPAERAEPRTDRDLTVRVAKATAAALAVAALGFGIWRVRSVLILLLLALTLAAAIRPGVEWLGRHRVPQPVAILLHFLAVGGALALFVWLAVPPALHQIGHALDPNTLAGTPLAHPTGVRDRALTWLQQHLGRLPTGRQLLHPVATYGEKAGAAVVAIFFTLAATWYCVSERDAIVKLLTALSPESERDRARETYLAIDRRLGAYTRLRFLMIFAVGAVLSAGFYVIGLKYWLLVGAFVGLVEIVPLVGPIIGSLLVLAVGVPQSLHIAALALLWLVVVREFQNYVVNPRIGQTVGLSPLVTLVCVAVVGLLFGGLAVILAVPFTSAVATVIDVLVLGHEPPSAEPRRSLRLRRSG